MKRLLIIYFLHLLKKCCKINQCRIKIIGDVEHMMRETGVFELQECMGKFALLTVTVFIGLWCGIKGSYAAFYIAALIQALNNAYDAFGYLSVYDTVTKAAQAFIFLFAVAVFIISIIHFTEGGEIMDNSGCLIFTTISLSMPIVFWGSESVYLIFQKKY